MIQALLDGMASRRIGRAAEDALLDQTLVRVDQKTYTHFLKVLDQPPGGEGYDRLMKVKKPWKA